MKNTKFYDDKGNLVPKNRQKCKCGHVASTHVQLHYHPMSGYACTAAKCKCKSFTFSHIF